MYMCVYVRTSVHGECVCVCVTGGGGRLTYLGYSVVGDVEHLEFYERGQTLCTSSSSSSSTVDVADNIHAHTCTLTLKTSPPPCILDTDHSCQPQGCTLQP